MLLLFINRLLVASSIETWSVHKFATIKMTRTACIRLFAIVLSFITAYGFIGNQAIWRKQGLKTISMSLEPTSANSQVKQRLSTGIKQIGKAASLLTIFTLNGASANAKAASIDDFLGSLATMIVAKQVMQPTKAYVERQAYDAARSNIKYILNDLQLQKQVLNLVQNSIEFVDDMDAIDAAQEAGNRIANTAIQYDSTVYTCVFIPSDDGTVPPSAEKYRTQAYNFYTAFNNDIETLLKLANEEQLQKAQEFAKKRSKDLPPVLFKDGSNLRSTGI